MDDYNVQLLVPTVGSAPTQQEPGYHTWPRIRTVCATSVNRNQIDTGAQFSVILGTGANLHNYILIEILLKKCDIESVNLWVQLTVQTFTTMH